MNKGEMIKDIKAIIDDRCEAELGQVHAESKGGKVTKSVSTSLIARDIYYEGYRKICEGMQVVNTDQLNETLGSVLESGKRMGHAQGRDETARRILTTIYTYLKGATTQQTTALMIVKALAIDHGIELE